MAGSGECVDFEGELDVSGNAFSPMGWSSTNSCVNAWTNTRSAFDNYFHQAGVIRVDHRPAWMGRSGSCSPARVLRQLATSELGDLVTDPERPGFDDEGIDPAEAVVPAHTDVGET